MTGAVAGVKTFTRSYRVLSFLLLTSGVAAGAAQAADDGHAAKTASAPVVAIEAEPVWIRERTIPEATKARVANAHSGIAFLLLDEQHRTRADGHDDWFRTATKVTDRSGLESAGQLALSFDPAFETAGIAFIHLIRDGKIIDLTQDTKFRIVEREDSLKDGIVTGTLKAIANLRDVRVGDVVDYATTVHTRTALWPGHAFYHLSQRFSDPLATRALRFVWPAGTTPRFKALNSDVAFPPRKIAAGTEWEWIVTDPPAMRGEEDVPPGTFQWGRVDISTMKDWAELARWATALYQGDESLPGAFAARLDAIAKASPAPADRLTAAVRFVQDNIRYVGEELGEGSYVPRRPAIVLARGYGDCKDKSLLLAVALRRLGIDAVPALVSTTGGERLPDRLPSPLVFDHVIVRVVIDGKVLWLDPTGTHRGGTGRGIVPSDLGYALPIRAEQTALEHIDGYGDRAGRVTVLEQFAVDETADIPLRLHVETRFTDARADSMRARWANGSAKAISDANLEFYHDRFPGLVESKTLELIDDRDRNVLTLNENYTMPRDAFGKAGIPAKLTTRAYIVQNVLPARQSSPRMQPLALPTDLANDQTIELRVKDRVLTPLDDLDARAGAMTFSRKTTALPDGLRVIYRLDTGTRDAVPASAAAEVYALSDQIKDNAGIEFYLEKSPHTAFAPKGIDAATWAPIKADMEKAVALTQKNEQSTNLEALALLSTASGKVPHPSAAAGLIDGLKGAILSDLRRPQAAFAALQSATAQYDGNPPVYRLWLGYELDLGTAESFVKALERTIAVQPKEIGTLDKRLIQLALQKIVALAPEKREAARESLCMTLDKGGWQQDPRTDFGNSMLGCAIAAHSVRGNIVEARSGLAKDSPTEALLTMAIDRRHQALWPDIDRIGGDRFRKSLEREAARAAAVSTAAPKDYAAMTYRMQTLRALGRFQEALDAGKALASDTAQIEIVGTDAFWLVNEYASNLSALGRGDAAIAALDGVLALGLDRYPELVSFAINRAEIVVQAGRFDAGLASVTELDTRHASGLSDYGRMWVWATKSCALRALRRVSEAEAVEANIAKTPQNNWSAATEAAACRNDVGPIADLIKLRLGDSEARHGALALFITFDTKTSQTAFQKRLRDALAAAIARPDVQRAFAKYGRAVRYAGTTQGWNEF